MTPIIKFKVKLRNSETTLRNSKGCVRTTRGPVSKYALSISPNPLREKNVAGKSTLRREK